MERQKFHLGFQFNKQIHWVFGVLGVRTERAKGAVGGRAEEKACSVLLQKSKQKNPGVVQCVANYNHAKNSFCPVSCGGLQGFISTWREAKDIPPLFQTSSTLLGAVLAGQSSPSLAYPCPCCFRLSQNLRDIPGQVWLIQLCEQGQTQHWKLPPSL